MGINYFDATLILIFELWWFFHSLVLVQPGCACSLVPSVYFLYRPKDGSLRVMCQTAEWSLRLSQTAHFYMPVILGAFWRAEFETLTVARQISGSRWRYTVPAALERADREDNKTRPPNSVYLDSTSAVILDERDCLRPDNVWACWNCSACLFVCLCLSNRIARVVIHTCL